MRKTICLLSLLIMAGCSFRYEIGPDDVLQAELQCASNYGVRVISVSASVVEVECTNFAVFRNVKKETK